MRTQRAEIEGRTIRFHESGAGRAAILVHAFPLNADQWHPQLNQAPPGWRLVAPDLRGLGDPAAGAGGDASLEDVTIATHAADVLALMDHLRLERAVVAGLSMGGYVALALAQRAPRRLEGLVLADTRATPDDEAGRAARDAMIALAWEEGPHAIAEAMLPKLLGATSRRQRPELAGIVRELILRNTSAGIASAVRAMKLREDATAWLPRIECPVLVACGAEDVLTPPAASEAMARELPRAEMVVLPEAGHLSNLESPGAFGEAFAGFLGRLPPAQA
jgi:3-oxoadipate enol-lactonase